MKPLKTILALSLFLVFSFTNSFAQSPDIFCIDLSSGAITQVTSFAEEEFNPAVSPNGKIVAHDLLSPTFGSQDIYLTTLSTGASTVLVGAEGGNDAAWSPNGQYIAFDKAPFGLGQSIYYVPATGGTSVLIANDALDPFWSPKNDPEAEGGNYLDKRRIVFESSLEGRGIKTILANGIGMTTVSTTGYNPVWSNDGNYIAYGDDNIAGDAGDIFIQNVTRSGLPIGSRINVTNNGPGLFSNHPSWSKKDKEIVFSTFVVGTGADIEVVKLSTGVVSFLASVGDADFDPTYTRKGKKVFFSGLSSSPAPTIIPVQPPQIITKNIQQTNYPNPFSDNINLSFTLENEERIELRIFDMSGRMLRVLANGLYSKGVHKIQWDGTAADGKTIPPGIYISHLQTADGVEVNQIVKASN